MKLAGKVALVTGSAQVGDALVSDPRVHLVSFTGSTEVGQHLAKTAIHMRVAHRAAVEAHIKAMLLMPFQALGAGVAWQSLLVKIGHD